MLRKLLGTCLLLIGVTLSAGGSEIVHGTVRRDTIWSPALGVRKQMLVYLPASYDTSPAATKRYAVAVYLHGRWGDETDLTYKGHLAAAMDSLVSRGMPEMIVVMPDGDDGWWTTWETPANAEACRHEAHRREKPEEFCVETPRYDDFVVHDVLAHVDSTYRTLARPESRGVGGLSMGGYGAFAIAAGHPGTFGAAVSHGGVLTPGLMADSTMLASGGQLTWHVGRTTAELQKATGARWSSMYPMFGVDPATWKTRDPARLFASLKSRGAPIPALYADAAMGDEALEQNRMFVEAMRSIGVPMQYAEWSGTHTWIYWKSHLPDGLRFLSENLTH
jgi:putative tributyrin esterase